MSKLDVAKERIAYLKFWLGVLVVTDISLVGWLVSREDPDPAHKSGAQLSLLPSLLSLASQFIGKSGAASTLLRSCNRGNSLDSCITCRRVFVRLHGARCSAP
jgi:hypothetical protein